MTRIIRWVASGLSVLLLALWGVVWLTGGHGALLQRLSGGPAGHGCIALPAGLSLGGPFSLLDQQGKRVSEADFRGRWVLMYFGYAYCPDVCPTELQTIAAALDLLGERGKAVVPVFVTIDPERDTPAALADYLKLFSDRFVGLTGTAAEIAEIARHFRVYYAKVTRKGADSYLMDHSSFVYLLGPNGTVRALFGPDTTADALAAALAERLERPS